MLLEWILTPIFWIITNILSLIPTFELPAGFSGSFNLIFTTMSTFGYFLPVDTIITIIQLSVGFYLIIFSVSAFNWIVAKIPSIN